MTDPPKSFLGNPMEICIVTADHKRTIRGLHELGIGPWRVYTFSPANTTNQTYRGQASAFELRVCFAELSDSMVYEVIQPVSGANIFQEFLAQHGEGIHHIAYDMHGKPFAERVDEFEKRGFKMVQGGSWMGKNHFAFFETEGATGTCFETYEFPSDWDYPEPDEWFPSRPSS